MGNPRKNEIDGDVFLSHWQRRRASLRPRWRRLDDLIARALHGLVYAQRYSLLNAEACDEVLGSSAVKAR